MKKPTTKPSKVVPALVAPKQDGHAFRYAGLIALIAFGIYSNTLHHGFVLDDYAAITGNKFVQQGVKGFHDILTTSYWHGMSEQTGGVYRPLSLVMFALEWQFAPNNPIPGHSMNVILYALTGFLLFFLIKRMFPERTELFAFSICLLWIVHPLHTEVVANIKSRDEILCFLFGILGMYSSLMYIQKNKSIYLWIISVCYLLALLSKESALCFFILIPLTSYFFKNASRKQLSNVFISLALCTFIYLIIRSQMLGSIYKPTPIPVNDNSLVGAHSSMESISTAFYILGYYIYKFIFPFALASDYSFNQIPLVSILNPLAFTSIILFALMGFYSIKLFRHKNPVSYGILFYFFSIGMVSNLLFLLGSTMAERFMYMPSLGLIVLCVYLLDKMLYRNTKNQASLETKNASPYPSKVFLFLIISISILFSIKTYSRNKDWKSDFSLFSKDVQTVTENVKMKYFYVRAIMDELKYRKADPAKQQLLLASATDQMNRALKIDSNYYLLYNSTAEIYNYKKEYGKAIELYKKGLSLNNGDAGTYGNLGNIYFRIGQYDSAVYYQSKAIALNPNTYLNYNNLGGALFQLQRYEEAIVNYKKALELNPAYVDAYKNLGTAYSMTNHFDEAIENYNKVLSLDPNNATAYFYLGLVYDKKGDTSKAEFYRNKAKALNPDLK